jgi:rod shape-determining protein MreC
VSKLFARKSSIAALAVPVVVAVLFLIFPSFFNFTKDLSIKIITSPLVIFSSAGKYLRSRQSLDEENSRLRAKVTELSLEIERGKDLAEENIRLKELLSFKKNIKYETVSAEVISRDPNNWIGSFTINKGAADGLKRGAAVCSAKGLVGKVDDVFKNTSSVMLITHPGFRAGGMLRESRLHGVIEGDGKGYARMIYLPLDSDIKPGEIVVTSGYGREFPKGLVVGKIVSVEKSNTGLFKIAVILPEADAYDQEEVLCLK